MITGTCNSFTSASIPTVRGISLWNGYIVKCIELTVEKFDEENFKAECRTLEHLKGSGLTAQMRLYFKSPQFAYIIMDKLPGVTLSSLLEEKQQLSLQDWENLLERVHEMHMYGIVHGDLHRKNIIVEESPLLGSGKTFYLVDFEHSGRAFLDNVPIVVAGASKTSTYCTDYDRLHYSVRGFIACEFGKEYWTDVCELFRKFKSRDVGLSRGLHNSVTPNLKFY